MFLASSSAIVSFCFSCIFLMCIYLSCLHVLQSAIQFERFYSGLYMFSNITDSNEKLTEKRFTVDLIFFFPRDVASLLVDYTTDILLTYPLWYITDIIQFLQSWKKFYSHGWYGLFPFVDDDFNFKTWCGMLLNVCILPDVPYPFTNNLLAKLMNEICDYVVCIWKSIMTTILYYLPDASNQLQIYRELHFEYHTVSNSLFTMHVNSTIILSSSWVEDKLYHLEIIQVFLFYQIYVKS